MRLPSYPMRVLLIASCAGLAQSCHSPRPPVQVSVPADLFVRADRPAMTAGATESEAEYERVVSARDAWGMDVARRLDAACRYLKAVGIVGLECRGDVAEWERP